MSIAEPRTFYFLEEVFELLGTHLYGSTWTGWEITARPVDDPDESEQRRSELNAQIESSAAKMTAFDERIDATVGIDWRTRLRHGVVGVAARTAAATAMARIERRTRQYHVRDRRHAAG